MAGGMPKPRPLAGVVADDRLSEAVREVLRAAAAETTRLGHRYIGAEHALIALIGSDGATGQAFRDAGADAAQARSRIEFIVPREPPFMLLKELTVSPRLLGLIEEEAEIAASLDARVEPPDLSLALLRDGTALPARVLDECGVNTRALIPRLRALQRG